MANSQDLCANSLLPSFLFPDFVYKLFKTVADESNEKDVNWFESGIFKHFEFDHSIVLTSKDTDNVARKCKLGSKD